MRHPERVPQRTCIACGAKREQGQLIRIVRGLDGALSIGGSGRQDGRGAYICPLAQCWNKALKGTRLDRALRHDLTNENRAALLQYAGTLEEAGANG